jgi:hypothetical protein
LEIAARSPAGRLLGQPVRTTLLVDSGADITMIDEVYAAFLGVDLTQLPTVQIHGIGGSTVAREGVLMMDLCGRWVPAPVWFCSDRMPGLLGREVVFDNLIVAFAHRQSTFLAQGL